MRSATFRVGSREGVLLREGDGHDPGDNRGLVGTWRRGLLLGRRWLRRFLFRVRRGVEREANAKRDRGEQLLTGRVCAVERLRPLFDPFAVHHHHARVQAPPLRRHLHDHRQPRPREERVIPHAGGNGLAEGGLVGAGLGAGAAGIDEAGGGGSRERRGRSKDGQDKERKDRRGRRAGRTRADHRFPSSRRLRTALGTRSTGS